MLEVNGGAHLFGFDISRQFAGDIAGTIVADQPRLVLERDFKNI